MIDLIREQLLTLIKATDRADNDDNFISTIEFDGVTFTLANTDTDNLDQRTASLVEIIDYDDSTEVTTFLVHANIEYDLAEGGVAAAKEQEPEADQNSRFVAANDVQQMGAYARIAV